MSLGAPVLFLTPEIRILCSACTAIRILCSAYTAIHILCHTSLSLQPFSRYSLSHDLIESKQYKLFDCTYQFPLSFEEKMPGTRPSWPSCRGRPRLYALKEASSLPGQGIRLKTEKLHWQH
jgi:hypothetical protein